MPEPLPPRDYVLRYLHDAEEASRKWHDQIKRWRDLYNFKHYAQRPKPGEVQYADPSYTNTVDLAVGVLLGGDLDWRAKGWASSPAEEQGSSRIEKYLAGLIALNNRRNDYLIPYEAILNFVRDGCGVLYSVWDPILAERFKGSTEVPGPDGRPMRRTLYQEAPLRVQVIDPLSVQVVPGEPGRWSRVLRTVEMSVADVEATYGVALARFTHLSASEKTVTRARFIDFWELLSPEALDDLGLDTPTRAWYRAGHQPVRNAVLFEDEFVRPLRLMPGYDHLPYTTGFFKPVDRAVPENWGHGIIQPMETSVGMLERAINRRQRQIDVYSGLPIVSKTINGRALTVDPGLGNHVSLAMEEDIGFPAWPGSPPDVAQQMEFTRMRAQQASFPDTMYGSGNNQVAGYAISQLNDMSRIRLTQPTLHLELFFGQWAVKVQRMTRNFAKASLVRVYGRMRGQDFAEQVDGSMAEDYIVFARLKPVFPNEQTRRHAMATQVKDILSEGTIMEQYLDIEQPDDERRRKQQEQIFKHPVMQQYAMLTALKELADEGDLAAALTLQQMQQGQIPGGQPGRPTEPTNAEQPLGLPSPTGLPTPQEQGGVPYGQEPGAAFAPQAVNLNGGVR